MTLTLFLSLIILSFVSLSALPCFASEDEVRSLLEFKKGIRTDPLNRIFSTWNLDPNGNVSCPVGFFGVTCDSTTDSVIAIVLDRLGLTGDLKFNTLTGLKQLRNLSLSGNVFTGRLVPALGLVTSLQYLDLSSNQFYGPIPARLNDLWGLNHLNLSNNNFTGGFPEGIRNLQQLKVLDLHANGLWGDISELFPELRNIEYLDLSGNGFYGSLELSVENVSSLANTLQYMNLNHNKLGGGFLGRDVIALFRNLRVLDLGNNGITGELPTLAALTNLRVLRLGKNGLFGSIPVDFLEGLVPLEELDLSGNGFSGSIPKVNSTTLSTLNLSSNSLSGPLPASLGNCINIDLSRNNLSDDISAIRNWGASLEFIDVSSNNLVGSFPVPMQFQKLTSLNFGNNFLEGKVPDELGNYPRLISVDLSCNKLDGSIPPTFFTSTTLTNLNLSGNQFTGQIPLEGSHTSEFLVLPSYPPMEVLDLSNNSLEGHLSSNIGNLGKLRLLNLANNHFSGLLPGELNKLSVLEYLDLSNNTFNSEIPDKLSSNLRVFNVSYNDLRGRIPENLRRFPDASFRPGNNLLIFPPGRPAHNHHSSEQVQDRGRHRSSKTGIMIAIIAATVGVAVVVAFMFLAYYRAQRPDFLVRSGFGGSAASREVKLGIFNRPSIFKFHTAAEAPPSSLSFSNDHLLTSNSRSLPGKIESGSEIVEHGLPVGAPTGSASVNPDLFDNHPPNSGRKSSPGSPVASSPRFIDTLEQPVTLDVYSPDRLAGELFFLDGSQTFTAEELSRAPAEVLGRSSHGTLYKATLYSGHMLTVKWLRVGLVKHKKEFAKEVKKIGSMRHPNIVSLRAYYWGPREQERLILADYVQGESLALHLYETTPRRYSPMSFLQRLRVAVDVARCLSYLHDRGMPHGNLKPTNILLTGSGYHVSLTDYGLHRLMTPAGIAEQILNLGALGYRAPELATAAKPMPSFKADVYAFGVIVMELLTRRSAGDIISGQSGAVDLTDWVRLCDQEGRSRACIDRDIAGGEEHSRAMDELLAISLRCILPVNERPNIRQVFDDLHSLSV